MLRKVILFVLCAIMIISVVGCGGGDPTVEEVSTPESSQPPQPTYYINPLTGVKNLSEEQTKLRPVAVMINNINVAQGVQAGVQDADIIYETEVEGGITRLMAVFKDASAIKTLGTIRSSRYVYIDLALGHDAIYIHHGQDPNYAAPYLKSSGVADFNIGSPYAYREKNGLSQEHTLYSTGEKITAGIAAKKFRTTTEKTSNFADFREESDALAPAHAQAISASVKFSNSSTSVFTYNSETGMYTKNTKGRTNKDYKTGAAYDVKNVFILGARMSNYPIAKYRKIDLSSGTGYYLSEGGYEPIRWEKGNGSASFKFYAQDGTPLKVNAGKSWVCIHNSSFAPTFTAPPPPPEPTSSQQS